MKAAETKSTAAPAKKDSPFFSKDSEQDFFGSNYKERPFFIKSNNAKSSIQPKLTIGRPDDKYEHEANTMADKVVQRLSENNTSVEIKKINGIQTKPLTTSNSITSFVQTKCDSCEHEEKLQKKDKEDDSDLLNGKLQKKPIFESNAEPPDDEKNIQRKCTDCEKEEQKSLQTKSEDTSSSNETSSIESALSSSKGSGNPLPEDTKAQMESSFGADFSNVRIHSNSSAVLMSEGLNAQAFTHGNDIYFNSGKYDANSNAGKHLLAHELTHTVQQGASVKRKQLVTNPVVHSMNTKLIQRDLISDGVQWVKNQIKSGLNWAAERIIPGYSLLNVILGKNLITDEKVERSGVNIVRAYMRLVPVIGSILLSELEQTDTLTKAGKWTEEQVALFGINFNDIARRLTAMWDEMSVWNSIDTNVNIFKRYISPVLGRFLAFSGVMNQKMKELRLEGALRLVGATEILQALKNSPEAFKKVVDNPTIILTNFMVALKNGFSSFKDNFAEHFKNGLFGWLLGKAASMGIQMPKKFSVAGIFHLVAQLAGLTYQQIKTLVIEKLGPKYGKKAAKVFEAIEKGVAVVQRVITEGPIALWEMVKEQLTNLKEMVLSQITQLVTSEIIKSAVTKLLSMLNPVGALVQLVMTLYRVIKFFIDNWATIKDIAMGIISSITKVALGQLGEAAQFVEKILGKGVQLIISFLAGIFGLSGIADKVKGLLKKFGGMLLKARDWVVNWLVQKGKEFYDKVFGKEKGKEDKGSDTIEKAKEEIKTEGIKAGAGGKVTEEEANSIKNKVNADHPTKIEIKEVRKVGKNWEFEYIQRMTVTIPEEGSEEIEKEKKFIEDLSNNALLKIGPHATDSSSLKGKGDTYTPKEKKQIDEFGKIDGCHRTGIKDRNSYTPDHMPPKAIYRIAMENKEENKEIKTFLESKGMNFFNSEGGMRLYPQIPEQNSPQSALVSKLKAAINRLINYLLKKNS